MIKKEGITIVIDVLNIKTDKDIVGELGQGS